jgi:L-malate glycosyltransferase
MKILLLCHEYPPLGGGGGVGVMQYARAWREKGHKVRVITSWRPGLKFQEINNGIQIVRVFTIAGNDRARFSFIAMLSYLVFAFLHVWRHRTRYRRHHVINTHFALPDGILGLFASKILAIPNVLTIMGGDIYDPTKKSSPHRSTITRTLNGFLLNSADKIIAISSDTKQNAKRYYKVRQEITVINYGFLPGAYESNGASTTARPDGTYSLLAVGRLVHRKGF